MCTICGHAFTDKINLDQHVQTRHAVSQGFACNECGRHYKRKDHFQRHLLTHQKEESYMDESEYDTEMEEEDVATLKNSEETHEESDMDQEEDSCDGNTEEEEGGSEEETEMESEDEDGIIYTCKCGAQIRICPA